MDDKGSNYHITTINKKKKKSNDQSKPEENIDSQKWWKSGKEAKGAKHLKLKEH